MHQLLLIRPIEKLPFCHSTTWNLGVLVENSAERAPGEHRLRVAFTGLKAKRCRLSCISLYVCLLYM